MKASTLVQLGLLISLAALVYYHTLNEMAHELPEFTQWKIKYSKTYENEKENSYRQKVYQNNIKKINEINSQNLEYEVGENEFTDLTTDEFAQKYLKLTVPYVGSLVSEQPSSLQQDIDWVAAGAVGPVINQGQGGVSAIVATEAMTALTKIRDGALRILPSQTLIECAGSQGFITQYYTYVEKNGMPYNYTSKVCTGAFKISGYQNISDCTALQTNLKQGPVAVAVDATNWASYKSGIFSNCGSSLNHAALLVGQTSTYWRVKNSWGTAWGQLGYISLAPGNTCGICRSASRPM